MKALKIFSATFFAIVLGFAVHLAYASSLAVGVMSGVYTPTFTNAVNVAASTPFACDYMRVMNKVMVGCVFNVDPTAAAATDLGISLPFASNLAGNDLSGTCSPTASATERAAGVVADSTNDRASVQWVTADISNHTTVCTFFYTIK
jgi:hypothetical protein